LKKKSKQESKLFLICHTIVLDDEKQSLIKKQENFEAYGSFFESSFISEKHKNNIEETFTKYKIFFNKKENKTILCEDNCYSINLKNKKTLEKNNFFSSLNTYSLKDNTKIRFIHYIKFIKKNDLVNSFYLNIN